MEIDGLCLSVFLVLLESEFVSIEKVIKFETWIRK